MPKAATKTSAKKTKKPVAAKVDIYAKVTDRIVADLEAGVTPWTRPWTSKRGAGLSMPVRPRRFNGQPYTGINVVLLWSEAMEKGFDNPTWMTYRQAGELGGQVRGGEKAAMVVYANRFVKTEKDDVSGEETTRAIPFMKAYYVFNVEQIDGLPERFYLKAEPEAPEVVEAAKLERIEHAETFFANLGAQIKHGGDQAFYSPTHDFIRMPDFDSFKDAALYYATLGHESIHWTKHESRLNRDFGKTRWGDEGYAREELVAELGSAFLCADLGLDLEPRADHASYIASWLKVLKDDKRFIFTAASYANKAMEFLHLAQLEAGVEAGEFAEEDETDHMEQAA